MLLVIISLLSANSTNCNVHRHRLHEVDHTHDWKVVGGSVPKLIGNFVVSILKQ